MLFVVMGPILPQEAEKRGVGPRAVGMIFSIYAFVNFCVSPYMGKALQRGSVPEPRLACHHFSTQPSALHCDVQTPMPACVLFFLLSTILTHAPRKPVTSGKHVLSLVCWSIGRVPEVLNERA